MKNAFRNVFGHHQNESTARAESWRTPFISLFGLPSQR
jgi:hypothetical protein